MKTKKEYISQAESKLDELDEELDVLEAKSDKMKADTKNKTTVLVCVVVET